MFDKKIKDVMTSPVSCVSPDTTIKDVAAKMSELDIGTIAVCEGGDKPVGIVTDRDITVRATAQGRDPSSCTANDVMTRGVVYCREDQTTREAERLMEERQIRRLLVVDASERLVGIVALSDIVGVDRGMTGRIVEKVSQPSAGYAGH